MSEQMCGTQRNAVTVREQHKRRRMRRQWLGLAAALLVVSAGPAYARVRVFIGPGVVVPFGPFWGPYWEPYPYAYPYAYPPVVVTPPPPVYIQPAPPPAPPPPASWYYCDHPPGYYPYVQQCPSGWRQVPAGPP